MITITIYAIIIKTYNNFYVFLGIFKWLYYSNFIAIKTNTFYNTNLFCLAILIYCTRNVELILGTFKKT